MKTQPRQRAESYLQFLLNWKGTLHIGLGILMVVSLVLASRLQLKPSFIELLPSELNSVKQFHKVLDRIGGMGLLLVSVESPDFAANRKFVDALASELKGLDAGEIRYFEYKFSEVREFFERYGLHYLKEKELLDLKVKLQKTIDEEVEAKKSSVFSGFLGLDDADSAKEPKDVKPNEELELSFDPRIKRFLSYPKDYLASDDGKLMAIGIMARKSSLSVKEAGHLLDKIQALVVKVGPEKYQPEMKVAFAGNIKRSIDEYKSIKADIVDTSLLLVALIIAILFVFFWSWRLIFLLLATTLSALIVTMGFTAVAIGYLNTITAFLGSLVVATGINYGIILIARYLEERRSAADVHESLVTAMLTTSTGTILGSTSTAVSFLSLLFANNRGFSQFGIIGGVGILLCWIWSFTYLPIWIYQLEVWFPVARYHNPLASGARRIGLKIGRIITRHSVAVGMLVLALSGIGLIGFREIAAQPLEYDFSKLGNKVSEASVINKRIQEKVYKSSLTPAVVLMENVGEAKELCSRVRELVSKIPEDERVFQGCVTLFEFLPEARDVGADTPARANLRKQIRDLAGNRFLKYSDSSVSEILRGIHDRYSEEAPTATDLPLQLSRRFTEPNGRVGLLGFIYSDNKKPLEDGNNLLNYTQAFGNITLPVAGTNVSASGENFILADLLRGIKVDGPVVSLISFLLVMLLAFLLTGSFRAGVLISTCMLFATWWLLCMQGMSGIKYNFLNFIALPLTFGLGVDYPINVFLRMREFKFKNYGAVFTSTGSAVLLCSLTTIIGYITLLPASTQALVSFAQLALLGEIACIVVALVFMPVILLTITRSDPTAESDMAASGI